MRLIDVEWMTWRCWRLWGAHRWNHPAWRHLYVVYLGPVRLLFEMQRQAVDAKDEAG